MDRRERSPRDDFLMGAWQVRPGLLRLRGLDGEVGLEPRAMSFLLALADEAGEVVTRERLHARVWRDATVSDETVNRIVFDLRKALGDRAADPRYIETIRKVGYRLIAPVAPVPEAKPEAAPGGASDPPRRVTVALGRSAVVVALLAVSAVIASAIARQPSREAVRGEPPRIRPLTSEVGYETHPAVSTDGTRIAFAWDGGGTDNVDVYWRAPDATRPVRLTTDPLRDEAPAFSPDGRRLAFVRSGGGTCTLQVADVDRPPGGGTGTIEAVSRCCEAAVSAPVWSADGRALIFADRDTAREPFRLYRFDLASGQRTSVTNPAFGSLGDLYPARDPAGDRLAFVRATAKATISTYLTPAVGDLFVLDPRSASRTSGAVAPRRLTFDNRVIAGVTWSSDGGSLVYASRRDSRGFALWQVPVRGGEPRLVLDDQGLLRFPRQLGGDLVYERWDGHTDLWHLVRRGDADLLGEARRIQDSTRSDLNPSWHPGGERLAFTSQRTGTYEIWTSRVDGTGATQLTFLEEAGAESPAWSPDGRWIAFEANRDGRSHLFRIAAGGGEPQQLTAAPFDDRSPTWSRDGRSIYFGSNRSGAWQIWRLAVEGGETVQITRDGGYRALESGHTTPPTLLYAKRDQGGIWQRTATGEQRLTAALAPEHWGNWDVVAATLYFVSLDERSTVLHALDLATGEERIAGVVEGWISRETSNLAVAPDARAIVMARFVGLAADLMRAETGDS